MFFQVWYLISILFPFRINYLVIFDFYLLLLVVTYDTNFVNIFSCSAQIEFENLAHLPRAFLSLLVNCPLLFRLALDWPLFIGIDFPPKVFI